MTDVHWETSESFDIKPDQNGYGKNLVPNYSGMIGTTNARWEKGCFNHFDADYNGRFGGTLTISGTTYIDGGAEVHDGLTVHDDLYVGGKVTSNLIPTSGKELGSNDFRWNKAWLSAIAASEVHSHLIPESNNTYNLGSSSKRWGTAYLNSIDVPSLTLGSLTVTGTVTLNGQSYTFPGSSGQSGQALVTNGSGTLSWASKLGGPQSPQNNAIPRLPFRDSRWFSLN